MPLDEALIAQTKAIFPDFPAEDLNTGFEESIEGESVPSALIDQLTPLLPSIQEATPEERLEAARMILG